ncbi:MAG TPA: hypothetical protein VF006_22295 [Longimicrobium sp.]
MHRTRIVPRRTPARLLAAIALLLTAACGGGGDAEEEPQQSSLPEGVSPVAAVARMAMPAAELPACQPASTRKVFRMEAEWNGFWEYAFREGCPRPQLPAGFDWSKEMIILAAMGRRESPADSIQVRGSGVVGDSVLVVLRRTSRQDGCDEPKVRVWPRDLVRIPADARPVRFVEEQRKLPCPEPAGGS